MLRRLAIAYPLLEIEKIMEARIRQLTKHPGGEILKSQKSRGETPTVWLAVVIP